MATIVRPRQVTKPNSPINGEFESKTCLNKSVAAGANLTATIKPKIEAKTYITVLMIPREKPE